MSECSEYDECSDEYGPCEAHGETVCQREGASHRTADELCAVFVDDAKDLGVVLSVEDAATMVDVETALSIAQDASPGGCGWLAYVEHGEELADALADVRAYCETMLGELGFLTYWDDGYRIVQPSQEYLDSLV